MAMACIRRVICHPTAMTIWHYAVNGDKLGPVSTEELRQQIESGILPADTKVWSEGMPDWREASSLPQLSASPYAAPASDINDDVIWDNYTPSGPQVRPWVRFWARSADLVVWATTVSVMVGLLFPEWLDENDTGLGMALLVSNLFAESLMLSVWGTTPAKWILGMRLRDHRGKKLNYGAALRRSFHVLVRGQGLGIPLISLITHIVACNNLSNHGITTWDRDGGITVSHQTIPWWKWLLLFSIFIGFVSLVVAGNSVE